MAFSTSCAPCNPYEVIMFALEALKAKHGDCLLLHWGKGKSRGVALIDGGPGTIYADFLKPRLASLAQELKKERVKLDLTMVSHIDDDHIKGILDLAEEIESGDAMADIDVLWHNSLEGLLDEDFKKDGNGAATASVGQAFPQMHDQWGDKVLASVPQGQQLHAFIKRRGLEDRMNMPFKRLGTSKKRLVMAQKKPAEFKKLSLRIIGPTPKEIEELRKKWVELRKDSAMAGLTDRSPYNLSSIVALAEFDGKRMLLTGDARGDLILNGLEDAGLLEDGKIHVDLLKLPHHGSQNNVEKEFFERVTADVYVVSGDQGKFPNPHKTAMKWLAEARGDDDYIVYCTYSLADMKALFGKKLVTPKADAISVTAALK
jgi:hypothetical protein